MSTEQKQVSTITVEIVAVPAPPALEPPPPPPPVRTTTIKPAPSYQQQLPPDHQPVVPLAPRAKNYAKPRPPTSKLSLKQRLALPTYSSFFFPLFSPGIFLKKNKNKDQIHHVKRKQIV
jgi:hypothetical protein